MTKAEILDTAKSIVTTDRNQQYGEPEDNFAAIAALWSPYINAKTHSSTPITAIDVANLMCLFKIGRAMTAETQKLDTYIDLAGYAACAGSLVGPLPT